MRARTSASGPRVRPPERAPWRGRRRPKPRTQQPDAWPLPSLPRLWLRPRSICIWNILSSQERMNSRASGLSRCAFEWRKWGTSDSATTSSVERTAMAHMNRGLTLNDEPSSASSLLAAARSSRERVPGALRRSPIPASSRMRFSIEDLFECKACPTRGEGVITLGLARRGFS